MKSMKFLKPLTDNDSISPENSFELLQDPIRAKIMFEIILRGETTAEKLVAITEKSRSTISHHLKKLVESEIIEVYMNPTGKTKYYRIMRDLDRVMYSLDKEKLAESTPEEQSLFILEMGKMYSIINYIYANLYTDQLKIFQKYQPFDNITINKDEEISFSLNKKKRMSMPYLSFFVTTEEQAVYLQKKLRELMGEFSKQYEDLPNLEKILKDPAKHIVNIQILPFLDEDEIK